MNTIKDFSQFYAIEKVIAIDPGANGGLVVYAPNETPKAVKMPKSIKDFYDFIQYHYDLTPRTLVAIERLQIQRDEITEQDRGKMFGIQKMMAGYYKLIAALEIVGVTYVEIAPVSWQSGLRFKQKGKDKKTRKEMYKQFAMKHYPELKITLWNADAACICKFIQHKISTDIKWLVEKIDENMLHNIRMYNN